MFIAQLTETFTPVSTWPIQLPKDLAQHSMEDARLYEYRDSLWMACTVSQYPTVQFRSIVLIAQLIQNETGWEIGKHYAVQYEGNDFSRTQKNWLCFQEFCWYGVVYGEQIVLKLKDENVAEVYKSKSLEWKWGDIHGGAMCRTPKQLLLFFNSRLKGRYHIGCAELSPEPPFTMLRISKSPILYGQEGAKLDDNPRFKPRVVFACGAIWENGNALLSYGENDHRCCVVKLSESDLKL